MLPAASMSSEICTGHRCVKCHFKVARREKPRPQRCCSLVQRYLNYVLARRAGELENTTSRRVEGVPHFVRQGERGTPGTQGNCLLSSKTGLSKFWPRFAFVATVSYSLSLPTPRPLPFPLGVVIHKLVYHNLIWIPRRISKRILFFLSLRAIVTTEETALADFCTNIIRRFNAQSII